MRYKKYIPYLIIVGLVLYILSFTKEVEVVSIPPKQGTKTIVAPKPIIKLDTVHTSSTEYEIIEVPNPVNQELLAKYNQAKDSLERLALHKEAITEREYEETLVDSVQTITVNSKVIGTLTEQVISYRTNPMEIPIKTLKRNTSIYLGAFTTIPTTLDSRIDVGGQINIRTNKQLFNIGYTAQGTIMAGVAFKLF